MKEPKFIVTMIMYLYTLLPLIGIALITMLAMDLRESDMAQIILPSLAILAAIIAWYNYKMLFHAYRCGERSGYDDGIDFARRHIAPQHSDPDAPTR